MEAAQAGLSLHLSKCQIVGNLMSWLKLHNEMKKQKTFVVNGWKMVNFIWALTRENLSFGFPTKRVSNQSPQVQRLARKLKFHL